MAFTGQHDHTIDAKQRLAIPADMRSSLDPEVHGEGFYLVPGPNGFLWLWPEKTFLALAGAGEHTLLPADEMMEYEALLYSQSWKLELDKTGRIRIPERMIKLFDLGPRVTVIGVNDHLELRNTDEWNQAFEENFKKQREIVIRARQALKEQKEGGGKVSP